MDLIINYYFVKKAKIPETVSFSLGTLIIYISPQNLYTILQKLSYYDMNFNIELLDEYACGHSLLHYLVKTNDTDNSKLASYLIKNGACVNSVDINGKRPLHFLIRNQNSKIIKTCIRYDAVINQSSFPKLRFATKHFDPDDIIYQHISPFHYALSLEPKLGLDMLKWYIVYKQDIESIKTLLDQKFSFKTSKNTVEILTIDLLHRQKDIGKCGVNLYSICTNPNKYQLHTYVLLNDITSIKEYLANKSYNEILSCLKEKVELVTVNKIPIQYSGYHAMEVAKQMGYKELEIFLCEEAKNSIRASVNNQRDCTNRASYIRPDTDKSYTNMELQKKSSLQKEPKQRGK